MKLPELRKDPTVIEWLTTVNPRPNTERNYLLGFQWFTEWTGKDPETLLLEAEQEIKDGILPRQRSVKKYLTGFKKYLQDKGKDRGDIGKPLAPLTIKGYITGVKSFYAAFEIELPKLSKAGNKAQILKKHKDIPTKEDLQEVLKVCDPMEKAIILIGVSSGLAANEIINLKVRDFKKGYDPETGITTLDLRRDKVDFDFITFFSPECSKAIWDYLNYRARTSKINETRRLNQLEKQRIFSDNNYLFIKRKIDPVYLQTRDENLRRHDEDSFMKLYRFISDKARKNTPKGDWNLIRSHNMRKYFNSALLNAGADSFHVEFFMGHTLDATRAAYFRADIEKLKEIYKKYMPYLIIEKSLDYTEIPEYRDVKEKLDSLETEKETLFAELRAELEKLKNAEAERENIRRLINEDINERYADKPESEELKRHRQRILTDAEYRVLVTRERDRMSVEDALWGGIDDEETGNALRKIEEQEQENKKRILNTFADKL